jgi:hypothetical protein
MILNQLLTGPYATPLKLNGFFLTVTIGGFLLTVIGANSGERYGWAYPLMFTLFVSLTSVVINLILVLVMFAKNRPKLARAYIVGLGVQLNFFLLLFAIARGVPIGKTEGG